MLSPTYIDSASEIPEYSDMTGISDTLDEFIDFLEDYNESVDLMNSRNIITPGLVIEGEKANYREEFTILAPLMLGENFLRIDVNKLLNEENFRESFREGLRYVKWAGVSVVVSNLDSISGNNKRVRYCQEFYNLVDEFARRGVKFYLSCKDASSFGKDNNVLRLGFQKYNIDNISEKEHYDILTNYVGKDDLGSDVSMEYLKKVSEGKKRQDIEVFAQRLLFNSKIDRDEIIVTDKSVSKSIDQLNSLNKGEFKNKNPEVGYDDIGGLNEEIENIKEIIEWPLTRPQVMEEMNIEMPKGVLLYGPPGNGKTLMAKAIAGESANNFIQVSCSNIMQKFLGQSEERIKEIFEEARDKAPCVIFFDEFDSIAFKRGENSHVKSTATSDRVISQLLSEIDGLDSDNRVRIIASTNRKNAIDEAILRSGRIGEQIRIPVPQKTEDREDILNVHLEDKPTTDSIDTREIALKMEGFSGSDIEKVTNRAALYRIRKDNDEMQITQEDLIRAVDEIKEDTTLPDSTEKAFR